MKYEGYVSTGFEAIKVKPIKWDSLRVKDLIFKIGSGVTPKGGSEVYLESGIPLLRSQNVYNDGLRISDVSYIDEDTNQKMKNSQIRPFDLLINITGASIGRTCVVPTSLKTANINQHIIFLRLKKKKVDFIAYYFKSPFIKDYIMMVQAGTSKEALNMGQALNIPVLYPSHSEQTQIANYLDQKTAAIDKKIALLEQKSKHYQELRKSLINETVCRGLDKTAKLKDSGIDWIGKIPEHWEVKRLKSIVRDMGSGGTPATSIRKYYDNGIYNWVNTGDLNDGYILNTTKRISKEAIVAYPNLKTYKEGTLIFAMYGATIGKLGFLKIDATTNQACCCLNFLKHIIPKYIFFWLLCNKQNIISLSVGGTQPNVSQGILSQVKINLPPYNEQEKIAKYLDMQTSKIDQITTNIKSQIEMLKELRLTLINDVVTGQIRVCEELEKEVERELVKE